MLIDETKDFVFSIISLPLASLLDFCLRILSNTEQALVAIV